MDDFSYSTENQATQAMARRGLRPERWPLDHGWIRDRGDDQGHVDHEVGELAPRMFGKRLTDRAQPPDTDHDLQRAWR